MTNKKGIVQVYTGNGKGKTSAAWGQALRAVGHGWKVAVIRFLKSGGSGEVSAAGQLAANISVFGHSSPYNAKEDQQSSEQLKIDSQENFRIAAEQINSGKYDLVVLDEINPVLHYKFILIDEFLDVIQNRPPSLDLILTGRYAPELLISTADLVTEMKDLKHPFADGIKARSGIDY